MTPSTSPAFSGGPGAVTTGVDAHIHCVAEDLAKTLSRVLSALPGSPLRPQQLARSLGVNTWLASRLLAAAQSSDPFTVAHLVPGPEPLRRVLKAAGRKKVRLDLIRDAEASVDRFEDLIRIAGGDRGGLDTVISAWLPEVREKSELLSKQAIFKGTSQILGSATETGLGTFLLHPAANAARLDQVAIFATFGLRRLRPGASIGSSFFFVTGPAGNLRTLDGEPADDIHGIMLPEFSSRPTPRFTVRREKNATHFRLLGDEVGLPSAVDLVYAHVNRSHRPRYNGPGIEGKAATFLVVEGPMRRLFFDMLLHEDVYPGSTPELAIYNTAPRGVAKLGDPDREQDRIDLLGSVSFLGRGLSRFRNVSVPRYLDLISTVCSKMGWKPDEFRGYRFQIEYPIVGSQIVQGFDLPDPPAPR